MTLGYFLPKKKPDIKITKNNKIYLIIHSETSQKTTIFMVIIMISKTWFQSKQIITNQNPTDETYNS